MKLIFLSTFRLQLSNARRRFGPQNLKLMFVCGQCQKNGQVSEADKNRKYCSAKARHPWVSQTLETKLKYCVSFVLILNQRRITFLAQVDKRQTGGACEFPRKEEVDNSSVTPDQKTNPSPVWGMSVYILFLITKTFPWRSIIILYFYPLMLPWLLITTCRFFEILHDVEPFSTPLLLIKPNLSHQLTKSLPSFSRSVCTWRPGRSASTSGTAHLRTAPKKETFGSTWRRTTVGFSIYIWIHLWCFEACVITLPVVPPSSLPPS